MNRLSRGILSYQSLQTIELTKLQVGDGPVKLVASTIAEIEYLVPWLQECKSQGREVNVSRILPSYLDHPPIESR